ncbi:hypothetical protein [Alkalicoccus saliphilus]|uniref:Uncharacterized protein n=1 Tax=Alkalicoccus saliphilus TaxID=200989 RepID=A0A2T4U7E3_9BACI|nr:hypothetical protein [Alkalicoccus saliphilus]PTL39304.1 hypothetical protein C6Y45_06745 [Alkalicoccus saliphilus]
MKFYFDNKSSWKWMGALWLSAAVLTLWLGTARLQYAGFGWIEAAAFAAGVLALLLGVYFLNMRRVVLFYIDKEGLQAHEGPGRKRRKLYWGNIQYIVWEEEKFEIIRTDGTLETWQSDFLSKENRDRFKHEIAVFIPVHEKQRRA